MIHLYITLKSGTRERDVAITVKVDVGAKTLVLNEGTNYERFISFSLLEEVEIIDAK